MVFGGKFRIRRCNSKASYLPRQTRDKLNTTDPDHGSYKLTLTSNEDCINQNHHNNGKSFHDDIMPIKCNNLPDVLPVGVKIQQSSPPSTISSPRYGSNNNLSPMTPPNPTTQHCYPSYPNMKLLISKPPVHTQTPITRQNSSPTSPISPISPSSYSISGSNRSSIYESSSPKFMSQSTIDLKKIHILETKEDLTSSHNENILSPAQSENNITTISNNNQNKKALSPFSAKKEFHRTDIARKLSLEERDPGEGRIVRAELVNTILSSSPITKSDEKITRKDSLRENIEKITQLQSKLMSAHLVDNGSERKLLGFTTKTINFQTLHASVDSGIDKYTESSALSKSPISVQIPKDIDITDLDAAIDNKNESPPPPTSSPPPLSPELPKASGSDKISQMIPEFDGLKLMQRSELVLRVNPSTMEAASQTDEILDSDMCRLKLIEDSSSIRTTTLLPRAKHPAEIDCDNFSQDLVKHLPLNDKLSQLLVPSIIKTSSDYICGLYNPNVTPRPAKRDVGTSTPVQFDELFDDGCEPLNCNAGIMESKMELQLTGIDVILVNGGSNSDSCDLTKKKEELVNRLKRKVKVLNHEQTTIGDETSINDELGCTLLTNVSTKLRSIDATKFRTYIDDVGHITSLLLSLSGRLAKIENLLHSITDNISEKKILEMKRDRLLEQLDEAKRLKDDIDRRGCIVSKTLEQNLNAEDYADYDYFINMKAKLIVDSREIADKIKLSEEQLSALKDTLLQSDC